MTKKDFITLAQVFRATKPFPLVGDGYISDRVFCKWADVRDGIADLLESQNPNFNRERWLDYIAGDCGQNGGKVAKK